MGSRYSSVTSGNIFYLDSHLPVLLGAISIHFGKAVLVREPASDPNIDLVHCTPNTVQKGCLCGTYPFKLSPQRLGEENFPYLVDVIYTASVVVQ